MANTRAKAFLRASIQRAHNARLQVEDAKTFTLRAVEADPEELNGDPRIAAALADYEEAQARLVSASMELSSFLEEENGE